MAFRRFQVKDHHRKAERYTGMTHGNSLGLQILRVPSTYDAIPGTMLPGMNICLPAKNTPGLPAVAGAAATTATASHATLPRPRLGNVQRSALKIRSIQSGNGLSGTLIVFHLDKSKPARLPGFPIGNDAHSRYGAEGFKRLSQMLGHLLFR